VFVLLYLPRVLSCSHVVVATEIQSEESTSGCGSVVIRESHYHFRDFVFRSAVSYLGLVCSVLVALIT